MQKIMFDDRYELTQAVLEGRKTVTRRIIPKAFFELKWEVRGDTLVYKNSDGEFIDIRDSKYCKYKVGEEVAIAQRYDDIFNEMMKDGSDWDLYEDFRCCAMGFEQAGNNNKMFVRPELMPHRIKITNIRVERLQDIDLEDCLKEGIVYTHSMFKLFQFAIYEKGKITPLEFRFARDAFAYLIDHAGGKSKGTWAANPWVFVYEFKLLR